MLGVNADSGRRAARFEPPLNPFLSGVLDKLSLCEVRNAPSYTRCQLAYTPGIHERRTHGHAIGVSHDLMVAGLAKADRREAAALNRTLALLSVRTGDNLGPGLLVYLTATGATRAGVDALLRAVPGDPMLAQCREKLDAAIIRIGIRAGRFTRGQPDSAYKGCSRSRKLSDAVAAGKKAMADCAAQIGGQALLGGIAQAILPEAMTNSISERDPDMLAKFQQPEGAPKIGVVLHPGHASLLDQRLRVGVEMGGADNLTDAIFHLLKAPEYVVRAPRA